tara:strand:- start:8377 stop:9240 length:864 start_codon:yes stop_codon:yes gene_type:complete
MSNIKLKKGLGRGLSSLFGDIKEEIKKKEKSSEQLTVSIADLNRNQFQPRTTFTQEKLNELADSIKENGLIQPIVVRPDKKESGKYEIVAGERRWLASKKAGLHEVPVVVLDLTDNQTLEIAIIENIQRQDLNCIEEGRAYERLRKEFRYDQDQIAKLMGKSRSHISNTLRLLTLPQDVISMIEEGLLSAGQARPLVGLHAKNATEIAEQIVKRKFNARHIEQLVKTKKSKTPLYLDPNIFETQKQIEDKLGLKVNIVNKKNNSGKITVEYKNLEQFELISNLLKKN